MDDAALRLERAGIDGLPEVVRLEAGRRYAAVIAHPRQARGLADLVSGLVDPPPGAVLARSGPARLVPADGGLLPHLTVLGNLVRAYRVSTRAARGWATTWCTQFASRCGLEDALGRYPCQLNDGRRRVAGVVRARLAEPAVIVLEDAAGFPTWGQLLDPQRDPGLLDAAQLLVTPQRKRTAGFEEVGDV
jgi:hypothetical protein